MSEDLAAPVGLRLPERAGRAWFRRLGVSLAVTFAILILNILAVATMPGQSGPGDTFWVTPLICPEGFFHYLRWSASTRCFSEQAGFRIPGGPAGPEGPSSRLAPLAALSP